METSREYIEEIVQEDGLVLIRRIIERVQPADEVRAERESALKRVEESDDLLTQIEAKLMEK